MTSSTSVVLPDCGGPCTRIDWGQQEAGHEASRRERAAEAEADGVDAAEEGAEHIMRLRWLIPSPFVASPASVAFFAPAAVRVPAFLLTLVFQDAYSSAKFIASNGSQMTYVCRKLILQSLIF